MDTGESTDSTNEKRMQEFANKLCFFLCATQRSSFFEQAIRNHQHLFRYL